MATNLINDFRTKNRIYAEKGGYFGKEAVSGVSIDTTGRILSGGTDLAVIFAGALSGGQPLTFNTNLTASSPSYNTGAAVTVGVTNNPVFAAVTATTFTGNLSGTATNATKWQSPITVTLSGDVAGSVTFDGSGNVGSTSLTIQPDSVALGTDTTGNYVAGVTVNNGLSSSGTGEGASVVIGHNTAGGSSIASTNSNGTVIQTIGVTIDTYGHVTSTNIATTNLDSRYYTETEIDGKFSAIGSTSANWDNTYSTVNANSGNWNNAYTTANSQSSNNASVYTTVNTNSGNWSNAYTTANSQSANNASGYTTLNSNSGNWQNTYTTLNSQSSNNASVYTTVNSNSGNWSNAYTTANSQSANNASGYTTLNSNSGNWTNTYSNFSSQSSNNASVYTTVNSNSGNWNNAYTNFSNQSANNVSGYTSVNSNSGNWQSTYTTFSALSDGFFNAAYSFQQGGITLIGMGSYHGDPGVFVDLGLQTGDSPQFAGLTVTGDTTVTGNLSVAGDFTYINTTVTVTSALSVINAGTGPALYIQQDGTNPIAQFIDSNGDDIIFADDGKVGLGTSSPGEKLTVVGNISASGSLNIGSTATIGTLAPGSGNNVVTQESGVLKTRAADSRVWGSTLVAYSGGGLTSNTIPKGSGTNTIADSRITDNGTTINLGGNTTVSGTLSTSGVISTTSSLSAPAVIIQTSTKDLNKKYFTSSINIAGTTVTTFAVANLAAAKYTVVLVKGNNRTAFEILAAVETGGNTTTGTVYAVVDNQATSQLVDVDVSISGGNHVISISSVADSTTALIEGTAFYNA